MKELELTNVYNKCLLDDEDYEKYGHLRWSAGEFGHVRGGGVSVSKKGQWVSSLPRLIMGAPESMVVDHIDGNPLNNQRRNLRLCLQSENMKNRRMFLNNSSGFKGVCLKKSSGRWAARIRINGKAKHLGYFGTKEEAARVYDDYANKIYGEYASPNTDKTIHFKLNLRYKPTKFDDPNLKIGMVPLGHGKYALVSPEDYDRVMEHGWSLHTRGYAQSSFGGKKPYLHRFILDCPDNLEVDHINHDRLDCRRENMRIVTPHENCHNSRARTISTSKFKGVSWGTKIGKWRAVMASGDKHVSLGTFEKEEDAARAYDHAARQRSGEFEHLNFPDLDSSAFAHVPEKRTSIYRGVTRMGNKFHVRAKVGDKVRRVGSFYDEVIAAIAYDHAAMQAYGDKAKLNFPEGYKVVA